MKINDLDAYPFRLNLTSKFPGDGSTMNFTEILTGITLDQPAYVMVDQIYVAAGVVDSGNRLFTVFNWGCNVILGLGGYVPVTVQQTNLFSTRSASFGTLDTLNLNEFVVPLTSTTRMNYTLRLPEQSFIVDHNANSFVATFAWKLTTAPLATNYMRNVFLCSGWYAFLK